MDRIFIIMIEWNRATGAIFHNIQTYLLVSRYSGERLENHGSSVFIILSCLLLIQALTKIFNGARQCEPSVVHFQNPYDQTGVILFCNLSLCMRKPTIWLIRPGLTQTELYSLRSRLS